MAFIIAVVCNLFAGLPVSIAVSTALSAAYICNSFDAFRALIAFVKALIDFCFFLHPLLIVSVLIHCQNRATVSFITDPSFAGGDRRARVATRPTSIGLGSVGTCSQSGPILQLSCSLRGFPDATSRPPTGARA
jgi:hypothetical protein